MIDTNVFKLFDLSKYHFFISAWPYKVKKQGSRCTGTNDDEAWRGKVKSAAVCAAVCQGTAKYFSFGKADKPLNRACSADSGLHECDCYCEESLQCTTMDDANFDVYEFEGKGKLKKSLTLSWMVGKPYYSIQYPKFQVGVQVKIS